MSRHKDIMYSSRTRQNTNTYARVHMLKLRLVEALKRIPEEERKPEEDARITSFETACVVNIVHLIYQHKEYEGQRRITTSPARRCASIGNRGTKTRCAILNG